MAVMKEVVKSLASQKLSNPSQNFVESLDSLDRDSHTIKTTKKKLTIEQLTASAPSPVVFTKEKDAKLIWGVCGNYLHIMYNFYI